MIGLAAMAGLGLHFNTPDDAGGGGGNTSETPTETPATEPEVIVSADDMLEGVGDFENVDETPTEGAEGGVEATPETPETEAETPEPPAGEADRVEEETPATPAATTEKPAETPATPPAEDPAVAAQAQEFAQWEADFNEINTKLAKDGAFDAIDDAPKAFKTMAKGFEFVKQALQSVAQQQQQLHQERQAESAWQAWGQQNADVPLDKARSAFAEEVKAAQKDYPEAPATVIQKIATKAFEARVAALKKPAPPPLKQPVQPVKGGAPAAKKPVAAPSTKPPVTKGGGKIAPASSLHRPPQRQKTPEEMLAADVGGGIKDFIV